MLIVIFQQHHKARILCRREENKQRFVKTEIQTVLALKLCPANQDGRVINPLQTT